MRKMSIQEARETVVMMTNDQVRQFVHEDVLQTFRWLPREVDIEPDISGVRVAASPFCLHLLDKEPLDLDP